MFNDVKRVINMKTRANELRISQTLKQPDELDAKVNRVMANHGIKDTIGMSDSVATDSRATVELIRSLTYRK